jgi:hypothetical protein
MHRPYRSPSPPAACRTSRNPAPFAALALLLLFLTAPSAVSAQDLGPEGGVLFVDPRAAGANDGTSWDNAFTNLQLALDEAVPGQEIWLASGRYVPGSSVDSTFLVGVTLRGGFRGTETTLAERVLPPATPTILSGDVLGNDTLGSSGIRNNIGDNLNHVVTAFGGALIEQVIIEGGNARADGQGGGIIALEGGWELRDVTLRENFANGSGGAVGIAGAGSVLFDGVTLETNRANVEGGSVFVAGSVVLEVRDSQARGSRALRGGAIAVGERARLVVIDSAFTENTSVGGSGAIHLASAPRAGSPPTRLERSLFASNATDGDGGAVGVDRSDLGQTGAIEVTDCDFVDNFAKTRGGAFFARDAGTTTFLGGSASLNQSNAGGALYFEDFRDVRIEDAHMSENIGGFGGAVALSRTAETTAGSLDIVGGLFEDNLATAGDGGALYAEGFSSVEIDGVEMVSNSGNLGGGVYLFSASVTGTPTSSVVRGGRYHDNTARESGGAIRVLTDQVEIVGVEVVENLALGDGGGVSAQTLALSVLDAVFEGNTSQGAAGAALDVVALGAGQAVIRDSRFVGNWGLGQGGVSVRTSSITVDGCTFEENIGGGSVAALAAVGQERVVVSGSRFVRNQASVDAATVSLSALGTAQLVDSEVIENRGADPAARLFVDSGEARLERVVLQSNLGGAASVVGAAAVAYSVLVTDNRSVGEEPGGLMIGTVAIAEAAPEVRHATFAGNSSTRGPADLFGAGAELIVGNSLFADPAFEGQRLVDGAGGELLLALQGTRLPVEGLGDGVFLAGTPLAFDPGFVDSGSGDYRLRADSAAIDAGVASGADGVASDVAGSDRTLGARPDVGAYERACSNRGISVGGSCICEVGFSGAACASCDPTRTECGGSCNGNGSIDGDGCDCDPTWDGDDCERCADGWSGTTCDICDPSAVDCADFCNGNGRFLGSGECECLPRFDGAQCDTCALGFAGTGCATCAEGFAGAECDRCAPTFTGDECDECIIGFGGPGCASCAEGFTGDDCELCAPGFSGRLCQPDRVDPTPDLGADADAGSDLGGPDLTPDAGSDLEPGSDAALDATPDARPDTSPDAAPDATPDAASDSGADAASDAGSDASIDSGADSGGASGGVVPVGQVPTPSEDDEGAGCSQRGRGPAGSWTWLLALGALTLSARRRARAPHESSAFR